MKSKEIKLIALDLDGTVLTDSNTLSVKVKRSLERAIQSGIEVVAASGRPYGSMPKNVLGIEGLNYSITSNGAAVHDNSGRRIHSTLVNENDVISLLKITEGHDLIFEAYVKGLTYTDSRYTSNPLKYGCSEAYVDYVKASHGHIDNMREFIYNHRKELDSIEIICTNAKKRAHIRQLISDNTSGFYITSSSENFIEFMDKSATKGNAVDWLCNYLDVKTESTCACGNADNDADMIEQAGFGAAVENASKLCLDCADIIVPSNNSDGVARLIEIILDKNKQDSFLN